VRLVLTPPPVWRRHASGGQQLAFLDDVVLAWGGLVPLPHDRPAWMVRALSVDVDSTASVCAGNVDTLATSRGWPVRVAMATVVCAQNAIVEYRLGALVRSRSFAPAHESRWSPRERSSTTC
jgi:hypothetical protein